VNKPAGLLTQAPPGIDSLEARLKAFYRQREQKTGNVYLGVPHRLDRPASGAMVFARHVRAARRLAEQFEGRLVRKTYWALTAGQVTPAAGDWIDWLCKVPDEPRAAVAARGEPNAREAILHYRTRGQTTAGSWLEITLETGRTHQVRVQAASRGWPLLGDELYGGPLPFGESYADYRLRAIGLHARELQFQHPMTGEDVQVTAPLPAAWQAYVREPP
jgi:RluA family pseudouridine synthase